MQGDDEAEDGGEEHQHVQRGQGQQVCVTTPPLKKAIPQLRGPLFSLKPLSE